MTLTKSRLEQSHRHLSEAVGKVAIAISRKKLSRSELHEVRAKLQNADQLIESILNAQD